MFYIYVLHGSDLRWWVRNHSHQTMKVIGGTLKSVGERGETIDDIVNRLLHRVSRRKRN